MVTGGAAAPSVEGMPTAIVTGASRGLGLALARALAERGWRLVIDARGAGPLEAAAARAPPGRRGRHPRRRHRRRATARARRGRRRRARPARQQRERARAEPAAGARRLPARRARARLPRQRARAARRSIQLALPRLGAGARIVNVTSDAAVEPYEGWGGYGSSKAALEQLTRDPRRRAPASCAIYAVDPGDMRTRMHQEAFPGEDISDRPPPEEQRARPARADRGRPAERPLPRRRAAGARRVDGGARASRCARGARAAEAPRAGARRGAPARRAPRPRRRSSTPASATCPRTCAPATCSSSTRRRRSPPRCRAARADGTALELHLSTPLPGPEPPAPPAALGRRAAPRRRALPRRRAPASGSRSPAARRAELARALPVRRRGCGSPRSTCPARVHAYLAAHGRPIRYGYVPREWPLDAYQTVFADEPGSAEMPSAGRPFTPGARRPARPRRPGRAARAAHRRLLARARRARRTRSATASPAHRPRVNAHRAAGGRVIAVGTTVVRALETVAAPDGRVEAGGGLDRPRRHARARRARGRRPAHRLARARRARTCRCSRPSPAASCSSAPTPPRSPPATSGTSSATRT